jgi:hypothetical protein
MKRFTQIREAVQIFLILTAFPLDHVAVMGMLAAPQRRRVEPLQESPVDVIGGSKAIREQRGQFSQVIHSHRGV